MPTTINGIGTMYYGKKNVQTRGGVCEHCGEVGDLRSYQTRLWVTVVFVPVIPLGKKQIIDQCPSCQRHRLAPLGQWQNVVRDDLSESRAAMEQDPQDEEAALDHFELAWRLGAAEEADRLAEELPLRFPDSPDVQITLGSWHEAVGRDAQGDACFAEALRLDPDSKPARRAVGIALVEQGQLEDARTLLAFMDEPGADQDAKVLAMLGKAYHEQGDHEQALHFLARAAKASPVFVRNKQFRKMVKAGQATVPGAERILPRGGLWRRKSVLAAIVLAALIAILAVANYWIATHRTLFVLNGLKVPVVVRIDGADGVTVNPGRQKTITLAEGRHKAVVTPQGTEGETVEFTMAASWLRRFFRSPAFILNAGRGAVVLWQEVTYSQHPEGVPPRVELHAGEAFVAFEDVDYRFEEMPSTITTEHSSPSTRTGVNVLVVEPVAFISGHATRMDADALISYAEAHLRASPQEDLLLWHYTGLAATTGRAVRGREFLAGRLSDRPLRIEWHRGYQGLCQWTELEEQTLQRYRKLAKDEPDNSAALYLLGRIVPRGTEAMDCFDRALKADPKSPYPHLGKGFGRLAAADFTAARDALAEAHRLRPNDPNIAHQHYQARFALKEYAELEAEARGQLKAEPLDSGALTNLLELLVAQGRGDEAAREFRRFEAVTKAKGPTYPKHPLRAARLQVLYFKGDFSALARESRRAKDPLVERNYRFQCDLELGHVDKLARWAGEAMAPPCTAYECLLISIAYGLRNDMTKADSWRTKAREQLAKIGGHERLAASLLEAGQSLQMKDVQELTLSPEAGAIVLVAMAQACPRHKAELLALAGKLNFRLYFAHHFLKRAIAAMK